MDGTQPDQRPDVQGASRGKGEDDDAGTAGDGERAGATTEYAANGEPGRSEEHGGAESGTAADLDPHEPPGQG